MTREYTTRYFSRSISLYSAVGTGNGLRPKPSTTAAVHKAWKLGPLKQFSD